MHASSDVPTVGCPPNTTNREGCCSVIVPKWTNSDIGDVAFVGMEAAEAAAVCGSTSTRACPEEGRSRTLVAQDSTPGRTCVGGVARGVEADDLYADLYTEQDTSASPLSILKERASSSTPKRLQPLFDIHPEKSLRTIDPGMIKGSG